MSQLGPDAAAHAPRGRVIVGLLGAVCVVQVGYQLAIATGAADVGPFETVLARAVVGHFQPGAGPARFYGPYDGSYPSVLMHAPLYYRAAALAAWPLVRAGLEPFTAVLVAGRGLSLAATILLLFAAGRIAMLGGAGRRAGFIAAALVAASPILGNLMVMVRPDALGVAFQTCAVGLVVAFVTRSDNTMPAANSPFSALSTLTLACVLFAASVAIKQHNVTVAAVSGLVLLDHCRRGRVPIRPLIVAGGMGLALLVAYLSGENLLTSGRMWKTVFVYPSGPFRAINYAGWRHVGSIFDIVARRSVGLIALAGVAAVALRGRLVANKVDRLILLFLLVEIGTLVPLCLFNAGAAYNYALQAIVFASVMVARSLDRVFDTLAACPVGLRRTGELGLACGAALLGLADVHWIVQSESLRRQEAQALATIAADPRLAPRPADERYFVSRQHLNRLQGNTSLIHDDWLYGAFEQAADVEPRQEWLRSRLTAGPITQVVVPGDMQRVPGIAEPLSDLGYQPVTRAGGLTVWQRSALPHNE